MKRFNNCAIHLFAVLFLGSFAAPVLAQPGEAVPKPDFSEPLQIVDGRRVALVIGNSQYNDTKAWQPLPNAANDVKHISDVLSSPDRGPARFEVESITDGTKEQIEAQLRSFVRKAQAADVAVVYYSGHGFQVNGENYIVPRDAPGELSESNVGLYFVSMKQIVAASQTKGLSIFFLDACRSDVPTLVSSDATRGLVRSAAFGEVKAPQSVVFYATSIGDVAYDAAPRGSQLSPFATAVGAGMSAPGRDLPLIFAKVSGYVQTVTQELGKRQVPVLGGSWSMSFYFVPLNAGTASDIGVSLAAQVASEPSDGAHSSIEIALSKKQLATLDFPSVINRVLDRHQPSQLLALAKSGDGVAQYLVGTMYSTGAGFVKNQSEARRWLETSARSGESIGKAALAYYLMAQPNPDKARVRALLESASSNGITKAKSFLAYNLAVGTFGRPDRDEAIRLWKEAAIEEHAYAPYALALQGERQFGYSSLLAMARGGNMDADHYLCTLSPVGMSADDVADHCLLGAKAGFPDSRARVALLYAKGDGVETSLEKARYWSSLAMQNPELDADLRARLAQIR